MLPSALVNESFLPIQPRRTLRVGISPWANMDHKCLHPLTTKCRPGLELEIMDIVSHLLNFELEFKIIPPTGCGKLTDDGIWTGLIGGLQNNEIDITGNVCLIEETRENEKWLEHSYPVIQYSQSFLIKAREPVFQFVLLGPFRPEIWILLFAIGMLFGALRTCFTIITNQMSLKEASLETFWGMCNVTLGMGNIDISIPWLLWTCIVGFIVIIYSSFVQRSLMNVVNIHRPFVDHLELADKLYSGEYKLIDYKKPSSQIECSDEKYCKKLKEAVYLKGYEHFTTPKDLLTQIANSENTVFVNGEIWTRLLLENFTERYKLWIMEDEAATLRMSAYFFRSDFELKSLINQALLLIGSSEENIVKRYAGLSYMGTVDRKVIRGELPRVIKVSWSIFRRPIYYYLGLNLFAVFALLIERIYYRFKERQLM